MATEENTTTADDDGAPDTSTPMKLTPSEADAALASFCKILTYPTVSSLAPSTGAYEDCASYLVSQLNSVACLSDVGYLPESLPKCPVVVAKWRGIHDDWPVLILNSHYDVVPAADDDWTVDPFAAVRKDGRVYGRGAQDMKCVCVQYIEAIRKIHAAKPDFRPERTILLTFVPDEEVGGSGMLALLSSKLYTEEIPGVALALDEGLASTDDTYSVFYGERLPWWVEVTARGPTGHGSRFIESTAVGQLVGVANKALEFREGQRKELHAEGGSTSPDHSNCAHAIVAKRLKMQNKAKKNGGANGGTNGATPNTKTLGDVTSLNITTLQAGVRVGDTFAYNCVPPTATCSLDIRISPHVPPSEISDMLDGWCRECSPSDSDSGHGVTWEGTAFQGGLAQRHALTALDDSNPWWKRFTSAMDGMGRVVVPQVFPAATDSRFLRALGVRALGFSPMRNTEIMLHENDEYLEEDVFVEGVEVYAGLIEALGSAKDIDNEPPATKMEES